MPLSIILTLWRLAVNFDTHTPATFPLWMRRYWNASETLCDPLAQTSVRIALISENVICQKCINDSSEVDISKRIGTTVRAPTLRDAMNMNTCKTCCTLNNTHQACNCTQEHCVKMAVGISYGIFMQERENIPRDSTYQFSRSTIYTCIILLWML